jgi:hypothetical protein
VVCDIRIPQFLQEGSARVDQLTAIPWSDGAPDSEHLGAIDMIHSTRHRRRERGDGGADKAIDASPIHLHWIEAHEGEHRVENPSPGRGGGGGAAAVGVEGGREGGDGGGEGVTGAAASGRGVTAAAG